MIQFRILRVTERGLRFEYACILHFSQPGIPYIYTKVGFRKWKTKHTTRIFIAVPRLIHLWIVPLPNKFLHTSVTQHLRMSFIHCKDLPDATPLCLSRHVFRLLTVTTIPAQDTHASGHHISHLRSRGSPLLYLFVSFAWVSFTFLFALSHLGTHNSHFYLYIYVFCLIYSLHLPIVLPLRFYIFLLCLFHAFLERASWGSVGHCVTKSASGLVPRKGLVSYSLKC